MTSDVNAWAMANGCVRVYSGLMDMMNDNEIEGVLGHELKDDNDLLTRGDTITDVLRTLC